MNYKNCITSSSQILSSNTVELNNMILEQLKINKSLILELLTDIHLSLNKQYLLSIIRSKNNILNFISEKFKNDKDIVIKVVSLNGQEFKLIDETLKDNKEVVLAAVKKSGYTIADASERLKGDEEIILTAVTNYNRAIWYVSNQLQKNEHLMLKVFYKNINALQYVNEQLKEEIGNNHPIKYLEAKILHDKLQMQIEDKPKDSGKTKI